MLSTNIYHRFMHQRSMQLYTRIEPNKVAGIQDNQDISDVEISHTQRGLSTKSCITSRSYWASCFVGVFSYHSGVVRANPIEQGQEEIAFDRWTVLPANWLRQWGFSILCMDKSLHQEYRWTPIRVVPDSSAIFDACRRGSIEEVNFLLYNKSATTQDTTHWGWTLLHVSNKLSV